MKNIKINKLIIIINISLAVLLASCSFSSESVSDYIKENSQGIVIRKVSYEREYPLDKDGFRSVPSSIDCTLTYYLTNPQGIDFTPSATFKDDSAITTITAAGLVVNDELVASVVDKEHVRVTYSRKLLVAMEKGGDIGLKLSITPSDNSSVKPFITKLRCNSVPPQVDGACAMLLKDIDKSATTGGSTTVGEYIVCFNLEDFVGIHDDVASMSVSGLSGGTKTWTGETSTWSALYENTLYNSEDSLVAATDANDELTTYFSNVGFEPSTTDGVTPFYIHTGIDYDQMIVNHEFVITITDEKGLSSSVAIWTKGYQLDKPLCSVEKDTNSEDVVSEVYAIQLAEDEKYYTLTLSAPAKASDAFIKYSIYSTSAGETLVLDDYVQTSASIDLPEGVYLIKAFSRKDGWIDSDVKTWTITVGGYSTSGGITITAPDSYTLTFVITPTEFTELTSGQKATLTVTVKDGDGKIVENPDLKDVSMTLYDRGTPYAPVVEEESDYELTIPSFIAADTEYYILVKVTYSYRIYSGIIPISVVK